MAGAETWHRILNATERLQAKAPAEGVGSIAPSEGLGCTPRTPYVQMCIARHLERNYIA
jgi:hypothetical protein